MLDCMDTTCVVVVNKYIHVVTVSVVFRKVTTSTSATTAYSYMTEFLSYQYHIFDVTLYVCMFMLYVTACIYCRPLSRYCTSTSCTV